jgi:hypothetical protein
MTREFLWTEWETLYGSEALKYKSFIKILKIYLKLDFTSKLKCCLKSQVLLIGVAYSKFRTFGTVWFWRTLTPKDG